jgi:regulator of sigma E protease
MFIKIILGLAGLGIMVFFHELGHFIAAKLMGIEVEAFSLGWGRKILSFRYKGTEYCLSILPLGGYCKMKGDDAMKDAWESGSDRIAASKDSFYGASPWRRIIVAAAGPAMNFLFAIAAFSMVWFIGFSYTTYSNRIILESDFPNRFNEGPYPASEAGLLSGDYITAIDGLPILTYRDLQDAVAIKPEKPLSVEYTRGGVSGKTTVTPLLNKETGAGRIGVYAWIEPVIDSVKKDSAAFIAGLEPGDRILRVNGKEVPHSLLLNQTIQQSPSQALLLGCERDGRVFETRIIPRSDAEGRIDTGIIYRPARHSSPTMGPGGALIRGIAETFDTLKITVKSLGLLFKGIDLSQAVSGPLRITYFVGEVAAQGFSKDFTTGVTSILNFLSLLSVALFFMNLLPIPALDGGVILLFILEGIRRKPLSPRFIYRYQFVGIFVILLLVVLSTMSDVFYFFRN